MARLRCKMNGAVVQLLWITLLLLPSAIHVQSLPLSTSGRWIVDAATGERVKLRCVNWAAHMPVVLAEGLNHQPLSKIASLIPNLGFNCVRLTWATYMFTREAYEKLTVEASLAAEELWEAKAGIKKNNPTMLNLTVVQAYDEVVRALGAAGVMVVLDNHVSKPKWCCSYYDGNGFFGDEYFDSDEWLRGLEAVARRFKGVTQVVGMSMRNELRGPRQTKSAWYKHITQGIHTIHVANPDVLTIVSGLDYAKDLRFLARRPLPVTGTTKSKIVYEAHWYGFNQGGARKWVEDPFPSRVCAKAVKDLDRHRGFVTKMGLPLFLSEFGGDQRGVNRADNLFLGCVRAYAAARDLDWALWALQGSYYKRSGQVDMEETYGVLDSKWAGPKDPKFRERFRLVQDMLIRSNSSKEQPNAMNYQTIYHPESGKCLQADKRNKTVLLGDCRNRSRWSHNGDRTPYRLVGTNLCLKAIADESPVSLTTECRGGDNKWRVSTSTCGTIQTTAKFMIDGKSSGNLCLHMELDSTSESLSSLVLSKKCLWHPKDSFLFADGIFFKVLELLLKPTIVENSQSQWFTSVSTNV